MTAADLVIVLLTNQPLLKSLCILRITCTHTGVMQCQQFKHALYTECSAAPFSCASVSPFSASALLSARLASWVEQGETTATSHCKLTVKLIYLENNLVPPVQHGPLDTAL